MQEESSTGTRARIRRGSADCKLFFVIPRTYFFGRGAMISSPNERERERDRENEGGIEKERESGIEFITIKGINVGAAKEGSTFATLQIKR